MVYVTDECPLNLHGLGIVSARVSWLYSIGPFFSIEMKIWALVANSNIPTYQTSICFRILVTGHLSFRFFRSQRSRDTKGKKSCLISR